MFVSSALASGYETRAEASAPDDPRIRYAAPCLLGLAGARTADERKTDGTRTRGWSWIGLMLTLGLVSTGSLAVAQDELPGERTIGRLLQQRLDRDFRKGLLKVTHTERRGTAPQRVEGDERERTLVYYAAELRFSKDHELSGWDALNVGSLIWVLGSSAEGIQGVRTEGNRRGDVLLVSGVVTYARAEGEWTAVANEGRIPSAPPVEGVEPPIPEDERQLQRLASLGQDLAAAGDDGALESLRRGIDGVIAEVEADLAGERGLIRLATGVTTGEYHALGGGLAAQMNSETAVLHVRPSSGSADNLALVSSGRVEAAFAQNDVAYAAYRGEGMYDGAAPMSALRALCSVYPEAVQLVTREESGIGGLADLAGRAVDVGPENSGIRFDAELILGAAGLSLADLGQAQGKPVGEALDDLVAGQVDAVFVTGVYPFHEIAAHAARSPLSFVALTEEEVGALWQSAPFMMPLTLPARTYPGQDEAIRTVGVTALLVATEDLDAATVDALLDGLLAHGDAMYQHSVQAYFISTATADRGLSIPMHPAARAYLERD